MARHKSFTVATKVQVYFCDPQSPGNAAPTKIPTACCDSTFPENDLSGYSQANLDKVARRLNQRPRKTLDFETPASKLQASVASTG
jgi:IS30 family transposase